MRISAFSHRIDMLPARYRPAAGFTLIEMLVVLLIAALLAGLVAPSLSRTSERMQRASSYREFQASLSELGQRANALGQSFSLSSTSLNTKLADGRPVLDVPNGWRIRIGTPIEFSFTGMCSGGQVDAVDPDGVVETIKLPAPTCTIPA